MYVSICRNKLQWSDIQMVSCIVCIVWNTVLWGAGCALTTKIPRYSGLYNKSLKVQFTTSTHYIINSVHYTCHPSFYKFLMIRLQWVVFISCSASSRCRVRWRRLTGSVCRIFTVSSRLELMTCNLSVISGSTWRRRLRLASCQVEKVSNKFRKSKCIVYYWVILTGPMKI